MSIECPNCRYLRTPEDDEETPKWKCPKCEVVYSKFSKKSIGKHPNKEKKRVLKSKIIDKTVLNNDFSSETVLIKRQHIIIATILMSFIAGYFSGREHIKYEMRQAMIEATSTFKKGVSEIFTPKNNVSTFPPKKNKTLETKSLGVSLIEKGYRDFDSDIGNKAITFTLEFTNTLKKDIRAFDGVITFVDVLDNPIKKLNLSFTTPIRVHQTVLWNGEMDYNQFIDSHRSLRSKDLQNLKVTLELRKVLYSDGSKE